MREALRYVRWPESAREQVPGLDKEQLVSYEEMAAKLRGIPYDWDGTVKLVDHDPLPYVCPMCGGEYDNGAMKCAGWTLETTKENGKMKRTDKTHAPIYPVLRENLPAVDANRKKS